MALAKSQRSLKAWGRQKWRTKSGKKSSVTGERYLPSAAIKSLSASEYARTTAAKRRAKKKGKQLPTLLISWMFVQSSRIDPMASFATFIALIARPISANMTRAS